MTREQLEAYIADTYPCERVYPFSKYPDIAVFRQVSNRRGFAFFLSVAREKLGLTGEGSIWVVNLKCPPLIMGSFLTKEGIHPGYHMNKEHWLSVTLDDRLPEDELKLLLDISFEATAGKRKG